MNIRDQYTEINEFKRGYQPRSNLAKDENGDLLEDSNTILKVEELLLSIIECSQC
jgi:hypothetical protein